MARTALDVTRQDWSLTGQTTMGSNNSNNNYRHPTLAQLGDKVGVEEIVERMVALLLIRMVALVTCRLGNYGPQYMIPDNNGNSGSKGGDNINISKGGNNSSSSSSNGGKRHKIYSDYSTTTICKAALHLNKEQQQQKRGGSDSAMSDAAKVSKEVSEEYDNLAPPGLTRHSSEPTKNDPDIQRQQRHGSLKNSDIASPTSEEIQNNYLPPFPQIITPLVISQLRHYVGVICGQYHIPTDVPYHNVEHAYHVFLSANKLLDLMLCETPEKSDGGNDNRAAAIKPAKGRRSRRRCSVDRKVPKPRPTFGIKSDPLSQLAFLFSAMVHDVDHTGISNRQLVLEMDDLAILYNDQSVAEQRSLAVAFTTLKRSGYGELRGVLFPITNVIPASIGGEGARAAPAAGSGNEDFFKFRKLVIDLVLVTDIASPERTQIVKSKWKEAFGEVIVAEKLKKSVLMSKKGSSFKLSRRGSVDSNSSGRGRDAKARSRYEPVNNNPIPLTVTKEETATDLKKNDVRDNVNGGATNSSSNNRPKYVRNNSQDSIEHSNYNGEGNNSNLASCSGRPKYAKSNSQGSIGDNGSNSNKLTSGRPRYVRNNSQGSIDSTSKRTMPGTGLSSSFVSTATDPDSMRDSLLDCDSIDFSDSSSSSFMSDDQSLEDDFDASAVSRAKMNFDKNHMFDGSSNSNSVNSFNSVSDGNSDNNNDGQQQGDVLKKPSACNNTGPLSENTGRTGSRRGHHGNHRNRWSTGDLAEDLDKDQDQQLGPLLRHAASPPTSPIKGNASGGGVGSDTVGNGRRKPRGARQEQGLTKANSFKVTPIIHNPRQQSHPLNNVSNENSGPHHQRRKTHSARNMGFSQSMLTHRELTSRRPRARSEERRLGVRRALDLAGSTIMAYSGSLRGSTSSSEQNQAMMDSGIGAPGIDEDLLDADDDIDDFKATVVLEQMIRAADVAALLQDWDNSMKWSTRLYEELKNGFLANRGEDPNVGWYENQIKFFDFYILPLAKNLGVMGVFEENVCGMFVGGVKGNLARWLEEGSRATELMMKEYEEERRKEQGKRSQPEEEQTKMDESDRILDSLGDLHIEDGNFRDDDVRPASTIP